MAVQLSSFQDLHSVKDPNKVTNTVIFGHVKMIHARNDILTPKDTIDAATFRAISRLGDITYARIGDGFQIPRPSYNDVQDAFKK